MLLEHSCIREYALRLWSRRQDDILHIRHLLRTCRVLLNTSPQVEAWKHAGNHAGNLACANQGPFAAELLPKSHLSYLKSIKCDTSDGRIA